MKRFTIYTIILASALCCASPACAKDGRFEVSLDRANIAIGESAELGLSFYGTQSVPAPDVGAIDGLEVKYIGPSTMVTVINGQMSSSVTHMYRVNPLKTGRFQIGPFSFTLKGDTYTSNMVFLEVSDEKPVSRPVPDQISTQTSDARIGDRIFVKMELEKPAAYVNELVPVSIKLYVNRMNVSDIQLPVLSQEGFSKIEFKEPKQYREELDGVTYEVLDFRTKIYATRQGDFKVGPAKVKCNIMVRRRQMRPGEFDDEFFDPRFRDPFFDDFFSRYERHPTELVSQDAQLIVSPLPEEGRPGGFAGAVGDYQFIYSASPTTKVKVGDPITVRLMINGIGNFNTVLIPRIDTLEGFRAYEAQVATEEHSKTFMQVLIPEREDVKEIPRATFVFFNPELRQYKTIIQNPIPIQVEKGKDEAPAQVISPISAVQATREEAKEQKTEKGSETSAKDIIYIKEGAAGLSAANDRVYTYPAFWFFLPLPVLFLVIFSVIVRRRQRMREDPVYFGRWNASRAAKGMTRRLWPKLKGGDPALYYEALFAALQEYFGNRLAIPSAGVTWDAVSAILAARDIDRAIVGKVANLFENCDKARFGSLELDRYQMKDDLKEFEEVMRVFEKLRGI